MKRCVRLLLLAGVLGSGHSAEFQVGYSTPCFTALRSPSLSGARILSPQMVDVVRGIQTGVACLAVTGVAFMSPTFHHGETTPEYEEVPGLDLFSEMSADGIDDGFYIEETIAPPPAVRVAAPHVARDTQGAEERVGTAPVLRWAGVSGSADARIDSSPSFELNAARRAAIAESVNAESGRRRAAVIKRASAGIRLSSAIEGAADARVSDTLRIRQVNPAQQVIRFSGGAVRSLADSVDPVKRVEAEARRLQNEKRIAEGQMFAAEKKTALEAKREAAQQRANEKKAIAEERAAQREFDRNVSRLTKAAMREFHKNELRFGLNDRVLLVFDSSVRKHLAQDILYDNVTAINAARGVIDGATEFSEAVRDAARSAIPQLSRKSIKRLALCGNDSVRSALEDQNLSSELAKVETFRNSARGKLRHLGHNVVGGFSVFANAVGVIAKEGPTLIVQGIKQKIRARNR